MNKQTIPIFGVLTSIKSKVDGSAVINFETPELEPEQAGILWALRGINGYMCFAPNMVKEMEVPDVQPVEKGEKTPSQRLRAVLFVLHKQNEAKGSKEDADSLYKRYMEHFIDTVKKQLSD